MKKLTPLRAIRAKCRDCCCNQTLEIRCCPITDCPLYPYRMGHRPGTLEEGSAGSEDPEEELGAAENAAE